jgi:putative tryptophan/tyrosine transport system substrate-binding protein
MKRREFITLIGGAAVWPVVARAQQGTRVRWIGALMFRPESDQLARQSAAVLEESLAKLGWMVGRNLAIDYRWGVNDLDKSNLALAQVLRLMPDVILVDGGQALIASQQAAGTVPIVFMGVSEPVERGFVASLARPGGNTTGFTNLEATMGGKWLELFKEIAPVVSHVTAVFNPTSSFAVQFFASAKAGAQKLGIDIVAAYVDDLAKIETTVSALSHRPDMGLIFPPDGFSGSYRQQIVELTVRHGLPAISWGRQFVAEGGLASYGPDVLDPYRRAASYVDRILKGEKPADLPVQNPLKFELAINLKTAKALGLTVPQSLLFAADEVIE